MRDSGTNYALVISLAPYKFATRARKLAAVLARSERVSYVAPAKSGRAGRWDEAGDWTVDGVRVHQAHVRELRVEPSMRNMFVNLTSSYLPAFVRMSIFVVKTRARAVIANGPAVLPLALLHKSIFRSTLVLDFPERPGMVTARGSLASALSRFESAILRLTRRWVDQILVVTYADVSAMERLGFANVELVRNIPMAEWKAGFVLPPIADNSETLRLIAMGSIFEGRGYEKLIQATALANKHRSVELVICGPGRPSYIQSLREIAEERGISDRITFADSVPVAQVSQMYLQSDIGIVLYESLDSGNDGLSNKLFECVSSGRPVIASDLPENRRFVVGTKTGWLVDDTVDGIAAGILAAHSPKQVEQLAQHCRSLGDSQFTWEKEILPVVTLLRDSH